jgi:arylformamidase
MRTRGAGVPIVTDSHSPIPRLIDVSPTISPRLGVWPGDVPYSAEWALRIADGANIDLSAIRTTVHLGAHADAPRHYRGGAEGIATRALERYYGPCQVVDAPVARGARIRPRDLRQPVEAPRVLLRTGTFPDPEHWNDDFAALSAELVEYLWRLGVHLVGIDTPSIDPQSDPHLESHQAVADRDMAILEGLVLAPVAPGHYTLIALPLKLEGADASPVRAVLLEGE